MSECAKYLWSGGGTLKFANPHAEEINGKFIYRAHIKKPHRTQPLTNSLGARRTCIIKRWHQVRTSVEKVRFKAAMIDEPAHTNMQN